MGGKTGILKAATARGVTKAAAPVAHLAAKAAPVAYVGAAMAELPRKQKAFTKDVLGKMAREMGDKGRR